MRARQAEELVQETTRKFRHRWGVGQRRFEAAKINRLSADAPVSATHINADLQSDSPTLFARARWLAQNDPYIRRGLRLITNNVIGHGGIHLNPRILPIQNNNGHRFDDELNKAVANAWNHWGNKRVHDPAMRESYRQADRARLRNRIRDGESFTFETFGAPTDQNPFGYWLQTVDALRIPHHLKAPAANGNTILMGVELDSNWQAVAYYMAVSDAARHSPDTLLIQGRGYRRISADMVVHDFESEFPEQIRGVSSMVGAMRRAPMLDAFIEAALVASRNGASTMGWYKQSDEAYTDYTGDEFDDDEDLDLIEDMEPGTMRKLPRGWDVDMHQAVWPNMEFGDFTKNILRGIAADLNVSYNAIAQDLENVNLSSIRHGTQEDREQYKNLQSDIIEDFHNPRFARWVPLALMAGQITVGRKTLDANDRNIQRIIKGTSFQPRGWEFAEPLKDAQANAMNISSGVDTPQRIVESSGRDWSDHLEELEKNVAELQNIGLTVPLQNLTTVNAPQQTAAEDEE